MTTMSSVVELLRPCGDPMTWVVWDVRMGGTGAAVLTRRETPRGHAPRRIRKVLLDDRQDCAVAIAACERAHQPALGEQVFATAVADLDIPARELDHLVGELLGDDYTGVDAMPSAGERP
ncbi:hypothetical protein ACFZBU_39400 [Embleya sp. NPDC008237]|uniref:hypothetical protein n=1 Tax=Embleya sp. NPDC008237 TaxID=3363978 RepID=UPI0036E465FE